jgi:hypothetical protein
MQEKFGLEFRIVDTEYLKALRREQGIHVNPWTSFPRLITSMDWMKSGEALHLIKDVLPPLGHQILRTSSPSPSSKRSSGWPVPFETT